MKLRKVLSLLVALVMMFEVLPLSSLATEIADTAENVEVSAEAVEEAEETVEETVEEEETVLLGASASEEDENSSDESGIATVSDDATTVASGTCGDNLTWVLDSDGVLTISGEGDMTDYGVGTSPWYSYRTSIKSVVLSSGVTSIGVSAFYGCSNLVSISIPDSVDSVGNGAFAGCTSLLSVDIPSKVTSIEMCTFADCTSLESVSISENVTSIGESAFAYCYSLTTIDIPDKVESIGCNAFGYCTNLVSAIIGNGVVSIVEYAFNYCESLTDVYYSSTVSDWNAININWGNTYLKSSTIHCIDGIISDGEATYFDDTEEDSDGEETTSYGSVYYLTSYDESTGVLTFGSDVASGTYALSSDADTTGISDMVGSFVMITEEQDEDNVLNYTVTSIVQVESAVGEVTEQGSSTLTIDGTTYPVRDDYVLGSYEGIELLYHTYEGTIVGFSLPEESTGTLDEWNSTTGVVTIDGNEYYTNSFTDFSFLANLDKYLGYDVSFTVYEVEKYAFITEILSVTETTVSGSFDYYSQLTCETESYSFYYADSWFFNNPYTTYQHRLTKMSIRLAMAAADSTSENIVDLMKEIGIRQSDIVTKYVEPSSDSIGYVIGNKTIVSETGETSTLIVVAIRGGNYGAEWGGNFRVLPDKMADSDYFTYWYSSCSAHEGFQIAADQVLSGIQAYVDSYNFSGDIKIWVCGYSRAAATANLVGAELIYGAAGGESSYTFDGLSADGVFTFCFECPLNTRSTTANSDLYSSIINIVNPIDLVPKVAPADWGYTRYGTTLYTPSNSTTSDYSSYKYLMIYNYELIMSKLNNSSNVELSDVTSEDNHQAAIIDDLVSFLAESIGYYISTSDVSVGDQDTSILIGAHWAMNYIEIQDDIINFGVSVLGEEDSDGSISGKTIVNLLSLLATMAAKSIVSGAFTPIERFSEIVSLVSSISSLGYAHYPELCLAWIDSSNSYFENQFDSSTSASVFRKTQINCPVDISVYDDSGTLVAQIISDEVQEIENGIGAYIDSDDQKVLILPTDMEYKVYLTATDSGEVTYTVEQYNFDSGETEKVVSYFQVDVETGDELVGTVENLTVVDEAEYPLTLNSTELVATVSQTGDDVDEFYVSIGYTEGGTVTGGGTYTIGEYAKVTATADSGYTFTGWYVDDELVSTDAEYRFLVDSEITIIAVFAEEETEPAESETHTHTTETVIENYVAATATTDGSYDSVTYCTECGEIISESHTVIAAYGSGSGETIDWATALTDSVVTVDENDSNITTEDVVIEEPIEPTDTETEDDGEEPATEPAVEAEAETPAETNPTTGVAISLIPMAIATLAAVSSKRK